MPLNPKVKEKLTEFVDLLEEHYGNMEGFSVKLERPVDNEEGGRKGYSDIKEFIISYLTYQDLMQ